jgi:cytochrome P450
VPLLRIYSGTTKFPLFNDDLCAKIFGILLNIVYYTVFTHRNLVSINIGMPNINNIELFDPHSLDWLSNKFEIYKELRSKETAYWSKKYQMYVITRYKDVMFALNNPEIFSSGSGNLIIESPHRFGRTLGASDNPTHNVYKNIVKNAYSKDNIERISNCFSERVKEILKPVDNLNISSIIEDLSATVTAEIINPPYKKDIVKDLVIQIQQHSKMAILKNTNDTQYNAFSSLLMTMSNLKIPAKGPGIYNEYINNNPEQIELLSLYSGPALSGASSLTGALEILTLDMFRENQLDLIINNRDLIPQVINESLRFNASTGRFSRTVLKEIVMHGVLLKPGDRVALSLESANRDPDIFPNPNKFILNRNNSNHVAFGHGVHACIALAISKSLMRVWVEHLLDIYGRYRVVTDNNQLCYVMTASGNNDMISNIIISKDYK